MNSESENGNSKEKPKVDGNCFLGNPGIQPNFQKFSGISQYGFNYPPSNPTAFLCDPLSLACKFLSLEYCSLLLDQNLV